DKLKTEGRVISKYSEVLSLDSENREARTALAKIYYDKFREAELARSSGDMAYYKELIFAFDDGTYTGLLEKEGTLSITTNPAADSFYLYRFVEGPDRRMVPAAFSSAAYFSAPPGEDDQLRGASSQFKLESTGFVPGKKLLSGSEFNKMSSIDRIKLPKGSYLVVVQKSGYVEARIPCVIKNGEDNVVREVKLLKDGEVPSGFVYIPRGEFIMGGDREAPNSQAGKEKMVAGFLLSRHEVTVGEYLKFLNFIEAERPGSTENYLPRKAVDSGFYWQKIGNVYHPNFPLDWPVLGIAQVDARVYCKWLTRANNNKWEFRLPEEWEWEKAARGVDGRYFPWGNYFDYKFCSMGRSQEAKREGPDKVGTFALDESVYGVEDMAGNVSEWCQTFFDQQQSIVLYKGAGWAMADEKFARCAGRNGNIPEDVSDVRGFRIAISIKE
ncbi:MAG: SUMF1/EgtB/PvdO family nonheme iron enzyme, partial [Pseudomonadota bacterium]